MTLKQIIKLSGFVLIFIGTVGLLLNEFILTHSSSCTIIFAVVNLVGFANLAFAHFVLRR